MDRVGKFLEKGIYLNLREIDMDRVVKFLEKGIYLNLRDMEIKVVNAIDLNLLRLLCVKELW